MSFHSVGKIRVNMSGGACLETLKVPTVGDYKRGAPFHVVEIHLRSNKPLDLDLRGRPDRYFSDLLLSSFEYITSNTTTPLPVYTYGRTRVHRYGTPLPVPYLCRQTPISVWTVVLKDSFFRGRTHALKKRVRESSSLCDYGTSERPIIRPVHLRPSTRDTTRSDSRHSLFRDVLSVRGFVRVGSRVGRRPRGRESRLRYKYRLPSL